MNAIRRRKVALQPLDGARFNADRTRFCVPIDSRIACYRGSVDERGQWQGNIVGIAKDDNDACRFLEGAIVSLAPA